MKKFDLYDKTSVMKHKEQLPVGGYACKVMEVKEIEYSWGNVIVVSFDIAEGQYKDFYKNDYQDQEDGKKKWRGTYRLNIPNGKNPKADEYNASQFKSFIYAVEQSNSGYQWSWDEKTLKGKKVGLVFGEEEWEMDGRRGITVRPRYATKTEGVEDAKVPKLKALKGGGTYTQTPTNSTEEDGDDLPF
ncbi:MAG: hypothetical protein RSB43_11220 [Niameybacter sp.]